MKKNFFKFISIILTTICIVLLIILISMKSYAFKNYEKNCDLNKKVLSEINFVDASVIEAINKLNNISIARYKVQTKSINKKSENNTSTEEDKDTRKNSEGNNNSQEEQTDENKEEIKASQSVAVNSLTENEENIIDWDRITYIYENIYSTWPTISLDLKEIGIKEEQINQFSVDLNGIAQSINAKDKKTTLVNLFNLYSLLPNYVTIATQDDYTILLFNTKTAVLNAYVLGNEENKWNEISESVKKAEMYFENINEIVKQEDNRKQNIERTKTILKDFENSIVLNDKKIFFMQYKNTIQALETINN